MIHLSSMHDFLLLFCWPCILIIFVMKTKQMHCLSLIYFVSQPLHVSGIFIAHHQEVFTVLVYVQQLVRVVHITRTNCCTYSSILTQSAASQPKRITRTNCCTYSSNLTQPAASQPKRLTRTSCCTYSSILTRPASSQPKRITRTNCCAYTVNTSWWWAINTP
jgi:hypothetical protein